MLPTRTLQLSFSNTSSKRRVKVLSKPSTGMASSVLRYLFPGDIIEVEVATIRGYYALAGKQVSIVLSCNYLCLCPAHS